MLTLKMKLGGMCGGAAAIIVASCDRIPGTSWQTIAEDEAAASEGLTDPNSAQFRHLKIVHLAQPLAKQMGFAEALCGEINAKNRQGGYIGFTRFISTKRPSRQVAIDPAITTTKADAANAEQLCEASQHDEDNCLAALKASMEAEVEQRYRVKFAAVCGALPDN